MNREYEELHWKRHGDTQLEDGVQFLDGQAARTAGDESSGREVRAMIERLRCLMTTCRRRCGPLIRPARTKSQSHECRRKSIEQHKYKKEERGDYSR